MAVSVTSNMNETLCDLARRFGFDNITVGQDMAYGPDQMIMTVRHSNGTAQMVRFDRNAPPSQIMSIMGQMAAQAQGNVLDLRQNAIEGIPDILHFIKKAKEQRQKTDTILLAPWQAEQLRNDPTFAKALADKPEGTIMQMYGHNLEIRD